MRILSRIASSMLLALAALPAPAQTWPIKPVRFIVAFAPGGPADISARLISVKLAESLGQQIVIENRSGAGGNIGASIAAKSAPDGYTVLLTTSALAVNMSLYSNPGYDAERDFIATALVASQPNMIFVNTGVPARTLLEFIDYAKTAKLSYASPGSGTTPHLTAENLFRVLAKLDLTPVHFRGAGPMVAAVLAGDPPLGSGAISGPLAQIKAGKIRGLAVSSGRRAPALPDVPTFAEAGFPGLEDYTWIAVFLPAGTPAAVVQKLNEAVNGALQQTDIRERLEALAFDPTGGSPQQAADYVRTEIVKWRKVVRDTGAKPD
ncbi:MAG: tripartite tricarboxylate transporter substrate binding protein [Betaproteobacteria bacterium]|nr:tripartite tricarboxylate transporter substrate binding protein [Betaproteobacteria bacterium]